MHAHFLFLSLLVVSSFAQCGLLNPRRFGSATCQTPIGGNCFGNGGISQQPWFTLTPYAPVSRNFGSGQLNYHRFLVTTPSGTPPALVVAGKPVNLAGLTQVIFPLDRSKLEQLPSSDPLYGPFQALRDLGSFKTVNVRGIDTVYFSSDINGQTATSMTKTAAGIVPTGRTPPTAIGIYFYKPLNNPFRNGDVIWVPEPLVKNIPVNSDGLTDYSFYIQGGGENFCPLQTVQILPYRTGSLSSASETTEVTENSDNSETSEETEESDNEVGVPGYAVGLLVLGSIILVLLVALIVVTLRTATRA